MRFVVGSSSSWGADGLAIWYTKERPNEGSVFGSEDRWQGLGVMFDTFDNDQAGENPAIYAVMNDGQTTYDASLDGKHKLFAHCVLNFRTSNYEPNSHKYPSQLRLSYFDGVLHLEVDSRGDHNWENCFSASVTIETGGYFGITAATGGVTDNHEIVSFNTFTYDSPDTVYTVPSQPQRVEVADPVPEKEIERKPSNLAKSLPGVDAFMKDVESRQVQFSVALTTRFHELGSKMSEMDKLTNNALREVSTAVLDLNDKIEVSQKNIDVLKADLDSLSAVVLSLSKTLEIVQKYAQDAAQVTETHYRLNIEKSGEHDSLVESHSWGFWIFFIIFQLFFWINLLWGRSVVEKRRRFD